MPRRRRCPSRSLCTAQRRTCRREARS
jgi:hypothetical protein